MYTLFSVASLGVLLTAPLALQAQVSSPPPPQPGQVDQGIVSDTVPTAPLTVGDKFGFRVIQTFGLRGALGAAIAAGYGQITNTPHEWGGGVQGYAERFGSDFGGNLSRQTFAWALDSALHQDPRYFPSTEKEFKPRLVNALKQTLFTRTDDGGSSFAYAKVISAFGSGQFVNIWQPKSNNSVGDGIERSFITLAGDAGYNFLQEFFPFTRPYELRHRH